jgi:hypothetical protein
MINRNPWPRGYVLAILFILALGLSQELLAQQAGPAPPSASSQPQTRSGNGPGAAAQSQPAPAPSPATSQTKPATPQNQTKLANNPGTIQSQPAPGSKQQQNDRIFFALPNYLTVENSASLPPLATREKFKTVAEGCFDPVEAVFIGIEAGIGQADNTNPTYGQGFVGYSKRLGTAYVDAILGNFGTGAIFPALLRQDPRYYQRGKGNFLYRAGYAALRVVITRSDSSGKTQFNFSEFLGNGMAAGIANAYHPGPHTLASNADVLGTQVVLDAAGYELKEFWPDIHRLLLHLHHKA